MNEQHPLVAALVQDAYHPPGNVVLTGFVGDSDDAANVRLYVDLELRSWFDIPRSAVTHLVRRAPADDPLSENVVWVDNEALLLPGQLGSGARVTFYPQVPAELLQEEDPLRKPLLFRSDPIGRGPVSSDHPVTIFKKKKKKKKKQPN
jgi:hypothetical protein